MATKKRWIVSWGYPDGKICWYFTDQHPVTKRIEMDKLDARAAVGAHFTAAAIEEVELGLRGRLSLRLQDKARLDVANAINAYTDPA